MNIALMIKKLFNKLKDFINSQNKIKIFKIKNKKSLF